MKKIWLVGYGLEKTFAHLQQRASELKLDFEVIDLDYFESVVEFEVYLSEHGMALIVDGQKYLLSEEDIFYHRAYGRTYERVESQVASEQFLAAFSSLLERSNVQAINPVFKWSSKSEQVCTFG